MTNLLSLWLCLVVVPTQEGAAPGYPRPGAPTSGARDGGTTRPGGVTPLQRGYDTSGYGGRRSTLRRGLVPRAQRSAPPSLGTYVAPRAATAAPNEAGVDPALLFADLARQLGLPAGTLPGMPMPAKASAPRAQGMATNGAPPAKWNLATLTSAPGIPSLLLQGITGGPLTSDEAQALADKLVGIRSPVGGDGDSLPGTTLSDRLLGNRGPDPELSTLQRDLDALQPAAAAGPEGAAVAPKIDGAALRGWFQALDVSRDAALSFLEWRDRTGLPLSAFRNLDRSGEGLLSFDEFARALLINAAQGGQREIDPALLDWALEREPALDGEPPLATSLTNLASLDDISNEEALARARAELAAAALLLPRPPPGAAPTDPAKAGDAGARPNGARQGLPAGLPPALKELEAGLPRAKVGGR